MKEEVKGEAKHLLEFCKQKGIKSDPLPKEYVEAGWFLVPLKHVKEVRKEAITFVNFKKK